MEGRFKIEMDEHKVKLDKEYESLMQNFTKELEKLRLRQQQELERRVGIRYVWIAGGLNP